MKLNKMFDTVVHDVTNLGSAVTYLFLTLLFFFIGAEVLALKLVSGIIITLIIIVILRIALFKPRPKKEKYSNIIEKIAASTFPSHHSANIGLLTVILSLTFNNTLLTTFMILVSIGVLFSRVYLSKHYWLDVSAGYTIGIILSYCLI